MEDENSLVKAPRLCSMTRDPSGYGFNLHGEKGVIGQYISAVDPGGPADRSGLSIGDRVVEVNGINVETFTHAEVVGSIKSNPGETCLLVVDKVTDSYLKRIGKPVTEDLTKYKSVYDMDNAEERDTEETNSVEEQVEVNDQETNVVDGNVETINNDVSQVEVKENDEDIEKPDDVAEDSKKDEDQISNKSDKEETSSIDTPASPVKDEVEDSSTTIDDTYESISDLKPEDSPKSNGSGDKSFLEKKREKIIPKRKQVKESKTDWKSKQDIFNNL